MVEHKWKNMYFFIFEKENQYKQKETEKFWRGRQLSCVESFIEACNVLYSIMLYTSENLISINLSW